MKPSILVAIQDQLINELDDAHARNTFVVEKNEPLPQCVDLGFNVVFQGSSPIGGHKSVGRAFRVLVGVYSKVTAEGPEEYQIINEDHGLTKHADNVKAALADFAFGETENYRGLFVKDESLVTKKAWKGDAFVAKIEVVFEGEYYEVL